MRQTHPAFPRPAIIVIKPIKRSMMRLRLKQVAGSRMGKGQAKKGNLHQRSIVSAGRNDMIDVILPVSVASAKLKIPTARRQGPHHHHHLHAFPAPLTLVRGGLTHDTCSA